MLRGGPSNHYDTSLKTGEFVLSQLRKDERYKPMDILITKDGEWHLHGKRQEPHKILKHADLVWNALHGEYGEDGELTQLLNKMGVPHTGSSTLGLTVSLNKDLAKRAYEAKGFLTPRHTLILGDVSLEDLVEIFRSHLHPLIVKPVRGRERLGVRRVHSFDELREAVAEAFRYADRVILEEYIKGSEASCVVVEGLRGERHYAFTPVPNTFTPAVHRRIEEIAKGAHEALGLRHYSLSDFIITPKGKIYIIETNALPSLSEDSHIHSSFESTGLSPKDFLEHVIALAKN